MRDESRRVTRLGYLMGRKLFLNFFAAVIPCHGFLDPLIWRQDAADGAVMVQSVDHQCDIFAHITVDIIRTRKKLRCLIDQVGSQDGIDDALFISFVELVHTVGKQAESSGGEDSFCLPLF